MGTIPFSTWSIGILPLIAICYLLLFWMRAKGFDGPSVWPKCAGSLLCVCTAGAGILLSGGHPAQSPIFWGLTLCMAGDYLIERKLILGGAAFGTAHILMLIWGFGKGPSALPTALIWIAAILTMAFIFHKEIPSMGKLTLPFTLYVLVLTGNLAVSAGIVLSGKTQYLPMAVGLLSFIISDSILGKNKFLGSSVFRQRLLMVFYYLALYGIAMAQWPG